MSRPITQDELDWLRLAAVIARLQLKTMIAAGSVLVPDSNFAVSLRESEETLERLALQIQTGEIAAFAPEVPSDLFGEKPDAAFSWAQLRRKHPGTICARPGCGHTARQHGEHTGCCKVVDCNCIEFRKLAP